MLGVWLAWFNVYTLVATMFVFLSAHGLNQPNAASLSLAPFVKSAGSASALLGSMRMAIGGIVSAIVSVIHNGSALPMVLIMSCCALGGLITVMVDKKMTKEKITSNYSESQTVPV